MNPTHTIHQVFNGTIDERLEAIELLSEAPGSLSPDDRREFRDALLTETFGSDNWQVSELIDLANDLEMFDQAVCRKLLPLLEEKGRDYLVKLSVLDYLFRCVSTVDDALKAAINRVLKGNDRLIVKNQALLFLIANADGPDGEESKAQLLINLRKTVDYQGHIRLYNTLLANKERYTGLPTAYIEQLISVSRRTQTGRAVDSAIAKMKNG